MKLTFSFLLTVLVSLSLTTHAQKCKLDVDDMDAFTKEHIKSGTSSIGGAFVRWSLTLKKTNNVFGWEMKMLIGGHIPEALAKGEVVYCKLEDDRIIRLIVEQDCVPVYAVGNGQVVTNYSPKGVLDEASIKAFSESALSEMRVTISGNKLEPKVSEKQGDKIKNIARCLLVP